MMKRGKINNIFASSFRFQAPGLLFKPAACDLRRVAVCCVLFVFVFSMLPLACFAQAVSGPDLVHNTRAYDGKTVIYTGEVIGEVMPRGDFAWANVYDGRYAIGVWMSGEQSRKISYAGSYKYKGDLLEITGVFNRACFEHGGDLDIHAESIRVLSAGGKVAHRLNYGKIHLSLALLGGLCLVLILRRLKRS